jgi:hypothetical protein
VPSRLEHGGELQRRGCVAGLLRRVEDVDGVRREELRDGAAAALVVGLVPERHVAGGEVVRIRHAAIVRAARGPGNSPPGMARRRAIG